MAFGKSLDRDRLVVASLARGQKLKRNGDFIRRQFTGSEILDGGVEGFCSHAQILRPGGESDCRADAPYIVERASEHGSELAGVQTGNRNQWQPPSRERNRVGMVMQRRFVASTVVEKRWHAVR